MSLDLFPYVDLTLKTAD